MSLVGLTSDPLTGVVARYRSLHICIEREDFKDIREALVKKLNLNINKYYPDAGGIMLGYEGIKVKKSTSELATTSLPHPVYIRAKFFLFQPQVGSELVCIVHTREELRVSCLAQGVFRVDVINPLSWDTVYVGQSVVVRVEVVEQMAWQEPKILARLVEITGDNIPPFIDFVEEIQEGEDVTVGVESEQNYTSHAPSTSMGLARGNGRPQPVFRKRKVSPAQEASPATKKPKLAAPPSPHSPGQASIVSLAKKKPKGNSKPPPPVRESVRTQPNPKSSLGTTVSPSHLINIPPPFKTNTPPQKKANIVSQILPKPDSGHDSSDNAEITCKAFEEPTVEGISKHYQYQADDTVEDDSRPFHAQETSVTPPKETVFMTPSKCSKMRRTAPPGFVMESKKGGKKKRVKLVTPHAAGFFSSYKVAWAWVDVNPHYLTYQVQAEEITPVVTKNKADEVSEAPPTKPKAKQIRRVVPTPEVKARNQKLLVDPPSFSDPDAGAQRQPQNLPIPESNTEYQSQSLLLPKYKKTAKMSQKSPKVGLTNSSQKVEALSTKSSSVSKSPDKASAVESNLQVKKVSKTSSKSSSSESSSEEEQPMQSKSGAKTRPPQTKFSSSSSYESDSSDNDTTGKALKRPTRPSESIAAVSTSSESESDSDTSEESELNVKKSEVLKSAVVKDKKDESSSSDFESETTQKHSNLRKVTKKKFSPKPAIPDELATILKTPSKAKQGGSQPAGANSGGRENKLSMKKKKNAVVL